MKNTKAQLDAFYAQYEKKVFALANRTRTEIEAILLKHGYHLHCGMGVWVVSNIKDGKTVYLEDIPNLHPDLQTCKKILDLEVEGMRSNCFGSIM
jgi:hypothetical protein